MKNKTKGLLASIILGVSAVGLTACGNVTVGSDSGQVEPAEKEKYVTFKVQDESGEWKDLTSRVLITDGKVTIPEAPKKNYYTFRGWFLDTNWNEEFKNEDLKQSVTVYAYYIADEVNIVINGESQGTRDLADVVNGTYNPGENLTFDGWYTNPECTVKFNPSDPAKTLYAQSVATITFNNGYEDVYSINVKPGSVYADPRTTKAQDEDGTELDETIEAKYIVKSYMSSEDIFYVDEDGNDIDFSNAIVKNTTIKVLWKSPFLGFKYYDAPQSNVLMCLGTYGSICKASDSSKVRAAKVPVISFPSRVTRKDNKGNFIDKDGNILTDGTRDYVEIKQVYIYDNQIFNSTNLKTVIVQEGVEVIRGFSSVNGLSTVEQIKLPNSLRLIQDSFNNLNITKDSVTIPSNVEGIYNSFWKGGTVNYNNESMTYYTGTNYDFDIDIPDSVKSLSIVPNNYKFSANSSFVNDGTMIYQNTEKGVVLISYNEIENGVITVPEGINGIQVGTFVNRSDIKKMILPSTFSFVNYNLNLSDFKESYGWYGGSLTNNECYLYSNDVSQNDFAYNGLLIISDLNFMDFLVFKSEPNEDVYKAFGGNENMAYSYGNFTTADNAIYKNIKVVNLYNTSEPKIYVRINNKFTNEELTYTIERTNNNAISLIDILSIVDKAKNSNYKNLYESDHLDIINSLNVGEEYDFTKQVNENVYLTINANYKNYTGFTYVVVGDEITVTGFDEATAAPIGDLYGIIIPSEIDGKKITKIDDGAFEDNALIQKVVLGSNIKVIGDKAFNGCSSIKSIDFNGAKLETIGSYAFADTSVETLQFSLENLTSVGEYAFSIETLKQFEYAPGEEGRTAETIEDGKFYFGTVGVVNWSTMSYDYYPIMLYQKVSSSTDEEDDITVYDVKLYAVAVNNSCDINLGQQVLDSSYEPKYWERVEVMEGAITYVIQTESQSHRLNFNNISKIHEKAITNSSFKLEDEDSESYTLMIGFDNGKYSDLSYIDDMLNDYPDLFEDGWYDSLKDILKATE